MIVVTGAAGFLGSNIIAELLAGEQLPIVAVDYFGQSNKWRNLSKHSVTGFVNPKQTIDFLQANANKISFVIHMGAFLANEKCVDSLIDNNINYSVALWDWCTVHKVPFIYASCSSTYGQQINTAFKDDDSLEALRQLKPLTAYAWAKHSTDLIFAQRAALGKAPPSWCGLKFFSVYGPNEYHKGDLRSSVTKFYEDIHSWDAVKLFKSSREDIADGHQKRDFVYVKDCSKAVLWFMENKDKAGNGIYNIGTGNARSFIELAKALEKPTGKEVEFSFKEMPEDVKCSYQYYTQANMDKVRAAGLNVNFRSLEAGIMDFIENHLSQPDPYR